MHQKFVKDFVALNLTPCAFSVSKVNNCLLNPLHQYWGQLLYIVMLSNIIKAGLDSNI